MWKLYLKWLYGSAPLLLQEDLQMFYTTRYDPPQKMAQQCHEFEEGVLFKNLTRRGDWDPMNVVYRYTRDRSSLPSHSWVEVTHCSEHRKVKCAVSPKTCIERTSGYWMYHRPGSGAYYYTGNTIAFKTHSSVAAFCKTKKTEAIRSCLLARQFTSVQFTDHSDQRCGNLGIEIVDLHGDGSDAHCMGNVTIRGGWLADGSRRIGCLHGCLYPTA